MTNTNEAIEVQAGFTQPFTIVNNEVLDCMSFEKPVDKLLYISLLRFAFGKANAYPSIPKLSLMLSVSKNTLKDALKRLEKLKLILVEKNRKNKENGGSIPNLYTLLEIPPHMKEDSVSNKEVYEERKKARFGGKSEGGSKSDPRGEGSKSDAPRGQKLTPRGSKIDPKEKELKKKNYKKERENNIHTDKQLTAKQLKRLKVIHKKKKVARTVFFRLLDKQDSLLELNVKMDTLINWIDKEAGTVPEDIMCLVIDELSNWTETITSTQGAIHYCLDNRIELAERRSDLEAQREPKREVRGEYYNWLEE